MCPDTVRTGSCEPRPRNVCDHHHLSDNTLRAAASIKRTRRLSYLRSTFAPPMHMEEGLHATTHPHPRSRHRSSTASCLTVTITSVAACLAETRIMALLAPKWR